MKKTSLFYRLAAAPHIVWSFLFIIAPMLFVLYYAFTDKSGHFTFSNIVEIGNYGSTFLISICFAIIATTICLLIGYPIAYAISMAPEKLQKIFIMLTMLPMWMNLLIRTYSWTTILNHTPLYNTPAAVLIGMVYDYLPYMILPIYTVLSKLDPRLTEAAADLGCNYLETFRMVILPLSRAGIISGITMVFVPSISTFYIATMLGGGKYALIGDIIESIINTQHNNNAASALSLVLMLLILISTAIMNKFGDASAKERRI